MNNNDILIRLRYALDIKNTDMVEIFKLGGIEVTKEEVLKMLIKSKDDNHEEADNDGDIQDEENESNIKENEENIKCNYFMLESFLNGFIIFKRGKQDSKLEQQDSKLEQPKRPTLSIKDSRSVNNVMMKKLKIALALSSEDMLDILKEVGVILTKGELSAVFRKEGHKNYKECGDRYARNFLKGLAVKYRK